MTQEAHKYISDKVEISISKIDKFSSKDIYELCEAAEQTMQSSKSFNIGFHKLKLPSKFQLEAYFNGITMMPHREIFVAKYDSIIAGSIQLSKPIASDEVSSFAATLDNQFVAPWARGAGLARSLVLIAEEQAKNLGFSLLKLSVRSTNETAIKLYESLDYKRWGTLEKYEKVGDQTVSGHFYYKDL